MVTVFCAIVGVAGSVFSVKIDENESVAGLEKAIKKENPNTFQCNAMDLQLFLTKKGNVWLREAHVKKGVSDTSGFKPLYAMKAKLKVVGLKDENDEEEEAEGENIVDVLVVNPQERSFQSFQPQHERFDHLLLILSSTFSFLLEFIGHCYSSERHHYRERVHSVIYSCDRLVKTKPQVLVARVLATRKPSSVSFSDYFKSVYNCELEKFWDFPCDRVILIDEAQLIYDDDYLWLGLLKNTYERRFPGPRIVLFSSYGGGQHECSGMDFAIDRCDTFGLTGSDTKFELKLSRAELDEMIGDSVFAKVGDLVWNLSWLILGLRTLS
ncbi:hypothetical protein V7S43_009754 [Phytophthora oleae]|uniref:Crinkler effector protein N-terminal domain-containing protein n=1 Tax=Phytophthora oleae TaxID=2107226 RepID=A0ABD3FGV7_9STRA